MDRMSTLSGAELDALFLERMIAHHAGGLQLADRALPTLEQKDLRALARTIVQEQAAEIGQLQALRAM